MSYVIHSLVKEGTGFVLIEAKEGPFLDSHYIEGAICWQIGESELLCEAHWDLVDQLWAYLIDGALEMLNHGEAEICFPDQPLHIRLKIVSSASLQFTVGEVTQTVPRDVFIKSLCVGGTHFFTTMQRLLPEANATWLDYLTKIQNIRKL